MSIVTERVHARNDELLPELETSFELGDDDDSVFYEEPPCLCAQQIISTLFGIVLGYIAVLLTPALIYFPLAFAQVRLAPPFSVVKLLIVTIILISGLGYNYGSPRIREV